jgi:3-hydroxyacyl-[acyl-carrier-protein] dehydratase
MTPGSSLDRLIRFLPQKPPFLFVEHVLELEAGRSVRGSTTFPAGHAVFENHLPDDPLVPGVIIIEALAQLAGIALMDPAGAPLRGYLAEVEKMRFLRLVRPDETIELAARLEAAFGQFARFAVSATVGGEVAARGVLTLARA